MENNILVAMSGGVDSAVTALLLLERGYSPVGATLRLTPPEATLGEVTKSCCNPEELLQAAQVASLLGIPHRIFDHSEAFCTHVVDYFVHSYLEGLTPNPCVACNRHIKFGSLLQVADELDCPVMATGHYARVIQNGAGRYELHRALDPTKDQSYVLWTLTQEQLSRLILPLGDYTKREVREIAASRGFSNAHKKDSQDICFVPDGDYASFIARYTGKSFPAGNFVSADGTILGQHKGMIHYTVGQRKGLGIAFGRPTYVCSKDPKTNTVVLGSNEELFRRELTARDINLIAADRLGGTCRLEAKVRYSTLPAPCRVTQTDEDSLQLVFDQPQRAICPGQSVVLYDGDTLVGGGIIQ